MGKLFPNTLMQIIGLLLSALFIVAPVFYIFKESNLFNSELIDTVCYFIYCLVVITTTYFINKKRDISLSLDLGINYMPLIPLVITCYFALEIGVLLPIMKTLTTDNHISHPNVTIIYVFGALILAPICEEIIFRGIILKGLLTKYPPKTAVIFSAFVFAISHGKPIQMLVALWIGLVLGWLYYKTKSLILTALLHFISNLSIFIGNYLWYDVYKNFNVSYKNMYGSFTIPIIGFTIIFLLICSKLLLRRLSKKPVDESYVAETPIM